MDESRVLLITGASSGIGAATARLAVEQGWRVVLGARSEDKLQALAEELGGDEKAMARRCDVTEWEDQQALVAAALEHVRPPRRGVRQRGLRRQARLPRGEPRAVARDGAHERATAPRSRIRAALAHFREQNAGHFVITGSVAGRRALPGSLYSSTKWAISGMGESLRQEVADTPMRVTVIEPGMVDTPFFDNPVSGALEADDIAEIVMFALSRPGRVDLNEVLVRPVNQPT